ncbi:hypothetical protein FGL86_00185 [Pistricoccus aurantiacus]|uniref:Uncharacterized protein n=1 Tax=Pistricoccus aurantiacus TaxID=1883414 RepID=A0A5B8SN15_9GAMM|nr:hypothetical protein [Pistricoccus aurantiacus]QEA37641.1 hypothetical protein FGL86_00185 [Pistricoccus aurantiacus]
MSPEAEATESAANPQAKGNQEDELNQGQGAATSGSEDTPSLDYESDKDETSPEAEATDSAANPEQ